MTNIQVALFDVDGVVIKPRQKFFSQRLIDDYDMSKEQIDPFVTDALIPSMTNKINLRDVLQKYIDMWKLPHSVDTLLHYWWSGENTLDNDVVNVVDQLRAKGVKTYLASDQEANRAEYLMHELALKLHFDGAFFSCDLGFTKHDELFWKEILAMTQISAEQIAFCDDDPKNVEIAQSFSIIASVFTNAADLQQQFNALIN